MIDHAILTRKLTSLHIPYSITSYINDFLKDRRQSAELNHDCDLQWENAPAGVPSGV